jgi:hypothetical protein
MSAADNSQALPRVMSTKASHTNSHHSSVY